MSSNTNRDFGQRGRGRGGDGRGRGGDGRGRGGDGRGRGGDGRGRGGDGRGGGYSDRAGHSGGSGDGGQRGGGGYRGGGGGRGGGDFNRGRRGGPRPQSPIRKNVREFAAEVPLKRVGTGRRKGTEGTAVELITNHYRIRFNDIRVFHYDIEIRLRRNDGSGYIPIVGPQERKLRKERQMENREVVERMANEWPEVFKGIAFVFDGQKNIYTNRELNMVLEGITRSVTLTLDGFSEQTFEVRIKYAKEVLMNAINQYFEGTLRTPNPEMFREALQVLDIVLRYNPTRTRVPVGRNLYSRDQKDRIKIPGQNALIAFGHHQSIQVTECGLTENVDRTATLFRGRETPVTDQIRFRSGGPLLDFIQEELGVRNLTALPSPTDLRQRLNPKLKGLKIFTQHIKIGPMAQKRNHVIEEMVELRPYEQTFTDSENEVITNEDYFLKAYNIRLQYRNIPLIQIKGGSPGNRKYLPVEVCYVYPDQPMPKRLINPEMQRQIVEVSNSQTPLKRFDTIQHSLETIRTESQDLIRDFGVDVNLKPIKLKGRVLQAPRVMGTTGRNPVKVGKPLTNYMFHNMSRNVDQNWTQLAKSFFNDPELSLTQTGRGMGIQINPINVDAPQHRSGPPLPRSIEETFKAAKNNRIQMIFFCIPNDSKIYSLIKMFGDVRYGIPTQCILDNNFTRTPRGYFNNILLKINAKLDGQNQVLSTGQTPEAFTGVSDTMIVGLDVTHPGTNPLANERVISSLAACVATYDRDCTKYVASISVQPMNTEIVANFDVMFGQVLREYFKKNKRYPRSVVVFRDGVADSQFEAVTAEEIPLIEKAYRDNRIPVPKITVFVVQKRHHTRFIPAQPERDQKGNEIPNIRAGTVVDHTIVNPLNDEYHLCSHTGRLGTSRHAKYQVLRDDHNWTADQKQKLSYYLCHAYCRCPTPISIPTPVKYADLAAFRAKNHIGAQNVVFEAGNAEETPDEKRQRELGLITALNDQIRIDPSIAFLPYYA